MVKILNKIEKLDQLLYREDRLYASRFNFFLLLQSFLFFAFIDAIISLTNIGKFIGLNINIFALLITSYFILIFCRTITYIHHLREELKKIDPVYRSIWNSREKMWKNKEIKTKYVNGKKITKDNKLMIKINKLYQNKKIDRGVNDIVGWVLPIFFLVVWLIFFIFVFIVPLLN